MLEKGVNNTRCMEGKSCIENEDKSRKKEKRVLQNSE